MAYVVDDTKTIDVVPGASPISDTLLEFFNEWEGSQYFFADTHLAGQTFKIGNTTTIPDSTFELTRFKFRAWADQPELLGSVLVDFYENMPSFPLPSPIAQITVPSTAIPSKGQFEGGWIDVNFLPGIPLIKNHEYFVMVSAPDAWWDTANQNRLLVNVRFSTKLYSPGQLWQYNLVDQSIYSYSNRDIAFQIFGTEVV